MVWALIWVGIVVFGFQGMFLDRIMRPDSLGGYFFTALLYVVICGVAGVVLIGVAWGVGQSFDSQPIEGRHSKLLAIRDKDGIEGRFFLGSGFVSSQPYYFYYEVLSDGSARPAKVSADRSVKVYQEDRADAEMVTFDWRIQYPWWAWIVCFPDSDGTGKSYDFHVPKGTIKPGYSM